MLNNLTTTLKILFALVRLDVINSNTINIYMYICSHTGESISNIDFTLHTGTCINTVRRHLRMLKLLDLIDLEVITGKSNVFTAYAKLERGWQHTLDTSTSLEDLEPSIYNATRSLRKLLKTRTLGSAATPFDDDDDWKRIEIIMRKFFTLPEINSGNPTSTKTFTKIYSIVEDDEIDFEAYAKWYKKTKYPSKGFSWGMFLYTSMLVEYKDTHGKVKQQLRTSSEEKQNKHAKNADSEKEFYDSIPKRRKRK